HPQLHRDAPLVGARFGPAAACDRPGGVRRHARHPPHRHARRCRAIRRRDRRSGAGPHRRRARRRVPGPGVRSCLRGRRLMAMRPPLAQQRRDLEEAKRELTGWLARRRPGAEELELSEVRLPGGGGVANETLLFDGTWTERGRRRTQGFVARVESSTFLFMEANFDLHPRIIEVLSGEGIPVPTVVGYEADTSILGARFFVMEKVDGQVPADQPPYNESGWVAEASVEQRRALWRSGVEALARLHAVPTDTLAFLRQPQRGDTGLEQYLRYNLESLEWAAAGRS